VASLGQPLERVSRAATLYPVAARLAPEPVAHLRPLYDRLLGLAAAPPVEETIQRAQALLFCFEVAMGQRRGREEEHGR